MLQNMIKIQTEKVRETAALLGSVNNEIDNKFQTVINAVDSLDGCWDGSASENAVSFFNSIKSIFYGNGDGARKKELSNYIEFLKKDVANNYEETESTNTKLSDLFK